MRHLRRHPVIRSWIVAFGIALVFGGGFLAVMLVALHVQAEQYCASVRQEIRTAEQQGAIAMLPAYAGRCALDP